MSGPQSSPPRDDAQDPVLAVLSACGGKVQKIGGGFKVLCPAHADKNPSLKVATGRGRFKVDLHCFAGCTVADVRAALLARGVSRQCLGANGGASSSTNGRRIDRTYQYRDESGAVLSETVRFIPKDFRQRRPNGSGGYAWGLKGVRRVVYRLPEVRKAIEEGEWVVVVEGEKDADRLARDGLAATCSPMGAGNWRDEHAELLTGAKVAVLPDNDAPGRKHADQVARSLRGVASVVKLITLPGLPERGDVSDWLESGHSSAELEGLITRAPGCELDGSGDSFAPGLLDTATLLNDTYEFYRRFVVCSEAGLVAGTLWTAHTHAFGAAEYTPRLSIRSAEAESGKTRYLEVLKLIVRAPQAAVNISDAALFRVVEARCPSVLHDEIDAVFGPKARDREDLRAMLNAGYERGATIPRCVGEGSRQEVRDFAVFAPVALAGLHKLPYTLETRSIIVRMKPRTNDEKIERLRKRRIKDEADRLRARWEAWAKTHVDRLKDAEPELPDELSDRAQDIWEPLLAIADLAGEEWGERARVTAKELFTARGEDERSFGRRLLADIKAVFDDPERDLPVDNEKGPAIASGGLAAALAAIEGAPWAEWSKDDKPISATKVARMLRPFDIRSDQHKIAGRNIRGYLRSDFEDAWQRHLSDRPPSSPSPGESATGGEVLPPNPNKGNGGNSSGPATLPRGRGDNPEQLLEDDLGGHHGWGESEPAGEVRR